jgi:predicted acylesterase/phospholipase RssA
MRTLIFLWTWIRRLPASFTFIFILLMALSLVVTSVLVERGLAVWLSNFLGGWLVWDTLWKLIQTQPIVQVGATGVVVLGLIGLSALISYNLAALIYQKARTRIPAGEHAPFVPAPHPPPAEGPASLAAKHLKKFNRIGIILAGGGAKGAYQAGAMKAIYEFLAANDCLHKVRMISGTSIGSWNSMFWLSDLVTSPDSDKPSAMETWWKSVDVRRIIEFDTYLPLRKNSFLLSTPWQESFDSIFVDQPAVMKRLARLFPSNPDPSLGADGSIHFYLTRANVGAARLEFATNSPLVRTIISAERRTATFRPDRYEVIALNNINKCLERTKEAVFASMDLPPLFPYASIRTDMAEDFEDGGVIDNLPVLFGTQVESCDLLFILPLNATFADKVDHRSIVKRLFRVMDVRQGVLEQNSLKMMYLYNELAEARKELEKHQVDNPALSSLMTRKAADPVAAFVICPGGELDISTGEFWKTKEAGKAFDLMYAQTKAELAMNFHELAQPKKIQMVVIGPNGERSTVEDF